MDRTRPPGPKLSSILIQSSLGQGFDLAGVVDVDRADLSPHIEAYDHWLEKGYSGRMEYLKRGRDRRTDVRLVFPKAQSVLAVAIRYPKSPAGSLKAQGPRYARYLQGPDYHLALKGKLQLAMKSANALWSKVKGTAPFEYKICVDTSAVLERAWAAECGLGWIGKNTLLINPKLGSYLFLAVVLISEKTGEERKPIADFCGHCTACMKSCPTRAIEAPRLLNATHCLSYLNLEHRGPFSELQKEKINEASDQSSVWIAGCDICQEVCPFNFKPARAPDQPIGSEDPTRLAAWAALLVETPEQYRDRTQKTALDRIQYLQASRNLAEFSRHFWPELKKEVRVHLEHLKKIPESAPIALAWRLALDRCQSEEK